MGGTIGGLAISATSELAWFGGYRKQCLLRPVWLRLDCDEVEVWGWPLTCDSDGVSKRTPGVKTILDFSIHPHLVWYMLW